MGNLSKREKRILRQDNIITKQGNINKSNFKITQVKPLSKSQKLACKQFMSTDSNLMLHGCAGTGKTFIALYLALMSLEKDDAYNKIILIRSTVPSREMGFLPGNVKEKTQVYEMPYQDICTKLYNRGDAYSILKTKNIIEFTTTAFIRGTTFDDCIVVVDEIQNMNDMELHTIMTRLGVNSRIIFCGDINQDDLTSERKKELSGLRNFLKIIENLLEFTFIDFTEDDILRHGVVKSYIIERNRLGL